MLERRQDACSAAGSPAGKKQTPLTAHQPPHSQAHLHVSLLSNKLLQLLVDPGKVKAAGGGPCRTLRCHLLLLQPLLLACGRMATGWQPLCLLPVPRILSGGPQRPGNAHSRCTISFQAHNAATSQLTWRQLAALSALHPRPVLLLAALAAALLFAGLRLARQRWRPRTDLHREALCQAAAAGG